MNKKVAQFISIVMHPLLMPTYMFLVIKWTVPELLRPFSDSAIYRLLLVVFIASFMIPAVSLASMQFSSAIKSVTMERRKDRILPFLFISLFYGITTYFFYAKLRFNDLLFVTFLSITILLLTLLIITLFWKISVHGASMGGILGFIYAISVMSPVSNSIWLLIAASIIWGLVLVARLSLNAHTPRQVYVGSLVGFTMCFFFYYFLL